MFKVKSALAVVALFAAPMIASPAMSHPAPEVQEGDLVPIPAYSDRFGEANADSSLSAAYALLSVLPKEARTSVMLPRDAAVRKDWSNLPAAFVERGGMKIGDMTHAQRMAVFEFLSASLSTEGYEKLGDILAGEAFLESAPNASRFMWSPKNYWFAFYGEPSPTGEWGWQFGGHHLAVNMDYRDGEIISISPTFLGTEPAVFTLAGTDYEVIVDLHQRGETLFASLNADQQRTATFTHVPDDVIAGAGKDGVIPETYGLRASDMTSSQRELLLNAIRGWVGVQPEENAALRMDEIGAELDDTYFTWVGTTQISSPSYYRIQGPDLLIELLSTGGNVGENAEGLGHYHTIYRRPSREYGE